MAFGSFDQKGHGAPLAEINMVPLIDVMLVLLVIFILTAPLLTHAVRVNLPEVSSTAAEPAENRIDLSLDDSGTLYWDGQSKSLQEIEALLLEAGRRQPVPELHIHADRQTRYAVLADIMAAAARAGVSRIGFVSQPAENAATP